MQGQTRNDNNIPERTKKEKGNYPESHTNSVFCRRGSLPCLLSPLPCLLSPLPCLLSPLPCLLSPLPCLLSPSHVQMVAKKRTYSPSCTTVSSNTKPGEFVSLSHDCQIALHSFDFLKATLDLKNPGSTSAVLKNIFIIRWRCALLVTWVPFETRESTYPVPGFTGEHAETSPKGLYNWEMLRNPEISGKDAVASKRR